VALKTAGLLKGSGQGIFASLSNCPLPQRQQGRNGRRRVQSNTRLRPRPPDAWGPCSSGVFVHRGRPGQLRPQRSAGLPKLTRGCALSCVLRERPGPGSLRRAADRPGVPGIGPRPPLRAPAADHAPASSASVEPRSWLCWRVDASEVSPANRCGGSRRHGSGTQTGAGAPTVRPSRRRWKLPRPSAGFVDAPEFERLAPRPARRARPTRSAQGGLITELTSPGKGPQPSRAVRGPVTDRQPSRIPPGSQLTQPHRRCRAVGSQRSGSCGHASQSTSRIPLDLIGTR